jgi:hypothetical protein
VILVTDTQRLFLRKNPLAIAPELASPSHTGVWVPISRARPQLCQADVFAQFFLALSSERIPRSADRPGRTTTLIHHRRRGAWEPPQPR